MHTPTAKDLFDFINERVQETANDTGLGVYQAFPRWFAQMYYPKPEDFIHSDGSGDGKIDLLFHTVEGQHVTYHAINSKYTHNYKHTAPASFYDEVISFHNLFATKEKRGEFLTSKVKPELLAPYKQLFKAYDEDRVELVFITNHALNEGQSSRIFSLPVKTFHLDQITQHVLDDLDGAMPWTPDLVMQEISTLLTPPAEETGVATAIVFARLLDFINYLENDPYDLLFARNVRVSLGNTPINKAIERTFLDHPEQFAYSNNGITVLCDEMKHDPGTHELCLVNPRVVNGCQTLNSVQMAAFKAGGISKGSSRARVMVRVVSIPSSKGHEVPAHAREKKEIVNRISIRSNQQNPIKKWNLVANDDFQMELARRFRRDGTFYERRDKEWSSRSRHLKSVGIVRGPSIKWMMGRLACYYWKNRKLGPALAKGRLGELFEGDAYEFIRKDATAELAAQVRIIGWNVDNAFRVLSKKRRYKNAHSHVDLVVLSLLCKALGEAGAAWRNSELTELLEIQWDDWEKPGKAWIEFTQAAADLVIDKYEKVSKRVKRREGVDLTLKNFVRRQTDVSAILDANVSSHLLKLARTALEV